MILADMSRLRIERLVCRRACMSLLGDIVDFQGGCDCRLWVLKILILGRQF